MEKFKSNKKLRLTYKNLRDKVPSDLHKVKSKDISNNVLALLESDFKGANIFLCYYPFGSEVDLILLYEKLLEIGKQLYFPISDVKTHELEFYQIHDLQKDFQLGAYNIFEPSSSFKRFEYNEHDDIICITPGLIFDRNFNRIGYGAGFYDRFFYDKAGIIKIAPCFEFQIAASVPNQEHDAKVNIIVTENDILKGDML